MRRRLLALCGLGLLTVACSRKTDATASTGTSGAPGAPAATREAPGDRWTAFDALQSLDACVLGHHGVLLDLGDATSQARANPHADGMPLESVEREGATWARLPSRSLGLTFVVPERPAPEIGDGGPQDPPVYVEARVRGGSARSASVFLNGKAVGSFSLARGETRVALARGGSASLVQGTNELLLRVGGTVTKGGEDVPLEVDWVHVGTGEPEPSYAAPTRADALVNGVIDGVSHRSLSLRAPGFLRCSLYVPPAGTLEGFVGVAGAGEGEADVELRLHRDRAPASVLGRVHVSSATGKWLPVQASLGAILPAGGLGVFELAVVSASPGVRVLLAEPRVTAPKEPANPAPPPAPARNAVLVVLSDMRKRDLAIYGGDRPVPELAALAAGGVVFDAHRASTSYANGALASMLTGLPATAHGIVDGDARLPSTITTMAGAAKQGGVSTAFFTANPTTSSAFGFERGWDRFVFEPPGGDGAATRVFDDAVTWLEGHHAERFLLVIHARGVHPPWEATAEELKTLGPENYAGIIDPKSAAELLARAHRTPPRLTDADRTRLWALYALALDDHDKALGRLLASLRDLGHEADTTVAVTGDVAVSETGPAFFAESEPVDEATLALPLVVHAPGQAPPGKRVATSTFSFDLGRTLLGSLGLAAPSGFEGDDLLAYARGRGALVPRPGLAAGTERFIVRWGPYALFGSKDRETKLCDIDLEPSCVTDVQATYPIALEALHRAAFDLRASSERRRPREPATIDAATAAALKAWGR